MDRDLLSRRIYITYKARINAAERLKKTNEFIQALNIYYSLFVTILSIYSVATASHTLSLFITVYSVAVTVTIVYLAAQNYGERAKSLKNNYVDIRHVLDSIHDNSTQEELEKINCNYEQLIRTSENHSQIDYYKAARSMKEEREKLTCMQNFIYFSSCFGSFFLKLLLVVFPFLLKLIITLLDYLTNV